MGSLLAMADVDEQREEWEDVAPAEDDERESAVDPEDKERLGKRQERLEDERPLDELIRMPEEDEEDRTRLQSSFDNCCVMLLSGFGGGRVYSSRLVRKVTIGMFYSGQLIRKI